MLETIRIRSYGYPFRYALPEFCERYKGELCAQAYG
jgi:myosin heavy subunit